ncbi:nuclear transport factor 2 family protein [Kribbella sp. NPDC050124]|uniref:nuclear transport factor 2 family protein n=1 Tax=Kribbella sp. NPDC050124 TaxID=3364114 RepID=UPI0037876037
MSEQVEVVRAVYDAFTRGDIAGMLGMLDPQVEWIEAEHATLWPGGPIYGPDEVAAQVLSRIPELFGDTFRIKVERLHECGDTVVMQGRYTATARATDTDLSVPVVHVWDIAGGKVVRWQQYTDTWMFAEATNIRPLERSTTT